MFKITSHKGFHMTFGNGITASVQWGAGNYCDNYDADFVKAKEWESSDAEVAAWHSGGKWCTAKVAKKAFRKNIDDEVIGRLSADKVLKFLNACAKL